MSPRAKNPLHDEPSLPRLGDEFETSITAPNDDATPTVTPAQNTTTGEAAALSPRSPLVSTTPQATEQGWQPALATPQTIHKLRAATPTGLVSRAYASAEDYSEPAARKTAARAEKWARRAVRRAAAEETNKPPTKPHTKQATSLRPSFSLSPAWPAPGTAASTAAPVDPSDDQTRSTVVSSDDDHVPVVGAEYTFSLDQFTASQKPAGTPCMHLHVQNPPTGAAQAGDAVDRDTMRKTDEIATDDGDDRLFITVRLYAGLYVACSRRK